jgi:hypothetical protein
MSLRRLWRSALGFTTIVAMSFALDVGIGQPAIAGSSSGTACLMGAQ